MKKKYKQKSIQKVKWKYGSYFPTIAVFVTYLCRFIFLKVSLHLIVIICGNYENNKIIQLINKLNF